MSAEVDRLTEPYAILPAQLFPAVSRLEESERKLRLAVLEDAIRAFQRHLRATDRRSRTLFQDALDWFSDSDRSEPFSFENVCDALSLDPDWVRDGLRRWHDAELARDKGRRAA